jgi:hypothetical protein
VPTGGSTGAGVEGEITGIIIGLVMMESRMMEYLCAQRIRTRQVWKTRMRLAAGALGLIALAGFVPGVAHAQDNTIFGSMLKGLGIGGENNIEYRERPPLVVPPTRDLPPPQTTARARDPNWPVDPKSGDLQKQGSQVRDLDRLPVPQRAAEPSVAGAPAGSDSTAAIPPSQPASSGGFFGKLFTSSDRPATAPVAPAPLRKSLTQPPPDYESPSPSQPYGITPPPAAAKSTTPETALQTQPGQAQPGPSGGL